MAKTKKQLETESKLQELTHDLQRTRADFENYRKRIDAEKEAMRQAGKASAVLGLLPVVDNIERAISHAPNELVDNTWVQGVVSLVKSLEKSLEGLNVKRIKAEPGMPFDPKLHDAIQFDEEVEGEHEIIAEELRAGYTLNGSPIRHSMVKVTRK